MPLRVFLVDITNRIGDDTPRTAVKAVLQTYFDKVAAKTKSDKVSVIFAWHGGNPLMTIIDSQVHAYEANTPKRLWHTVPN